MLIGIVGLISSGKGTVADRLVEKHGYLKDSFAKSLKDAVASMFNWANQSHQDGFYNILAPKLCVATCMTEYGLTVA